MEKKIPIEGAIHLRSHSIPLKGTDRNLVHPEQESNMNEASDKFESEREASDIEKGEEDERDVHEEEDNDDEEEDDKEKTNSDLEYNAWKIMLLFKTGWR